MNLGYEDNKFDVLGGNVDNFLSVGYFSGYDTFLDPYCTYLVDKHKKILWNTFFYFSIGFALLFLIKVAFLKTRKCIDLTS